MKLIKINGKPARSDMSTKAGDACHNVATDPAIINAVDKFDNTMTILAAKGQGALSLDARNTALDSLDTGIIINS